MSQDPWQTPAVAPGPVPEPPSAEVFLLPWEQATTFATFVETVKLVLLHPSRAFADPPRETPYRAMGFFLLITTVPMSWFGLILQSFYAPYLLDSFEWLRSLPEMEESLAVTPLSFFVTPVQALVATVVLATLTHVCLHIVGAGRAGLGGSLRAMAYTGGALALLGLIPGVGTVIAVFWWMGLVPYALKITHRTTWGRIIVASLLPLIPIFGLSVLAVVAAVLLR